jgi:hypothetical protein
VKNSKRQSKEGQPLPSIQPFCFAEIAIRNSNFDIIMKSRSDSTLAQLTDEQQVQAYDWLQSLGYTETIKRIAAPEPDGFGLKTYRSSLHRFFRHYSERLKSEHLEDAGSLIADPRPGAAFTSGAEQALHHLTFQLSTSPHDPDTFKELSRWITRTKTHDQKAQYLRIAEQHLALARERLALERDKFQFNAARQALLHQAELTKIMQDPHSDNEDKIQAARAHLFGAAKEFNETSSPQTPLPSVKATDSASLTSFPSVKDEKHQTPPSAFPR